MNDLASICVRLAARLMGRQASEWSQAMRAELDHVHANDRLGWAFGCLLAAIKQRFRSMRIGTLQVSRGILLLELVGCFLPMTIGWWDTVFGRYGLSQMNLTVVRELGISILAMMIGAAVIGLVGPIGLFLTSRAVTTGTGLRNRRLGLVMIAGVACFAIASIALRVLNGPGAYAANLSFILLVTVLPALGIAHLIYLAHPRSGPAQATA